MLKDNSTNDLYGYACPGRFGLGHSLLAWARCFIWCRDHNVVMLSPRWLYFRLGPYLRREMDKRSYNKLFRRDVYLAGLRRMWLLSAARRFAAEQESEARREQGTRIVVFANDYRDNTRFFRDIFGRHEDVRTELIRIARPEQIPELQSRKPFIGIHIRMGDFSRVSDPAVLSKASNVQLPVEWFREILLSLREQAGQDFPARVFSDGARESLRPLLDIPNVSFINPTSALHDILALSQATALISSSSGFSMWAAYLGQIPRVCYPKQRREYVVVAPGTIDLEPECETGMDIPAAFVEHIVGAFDRLEESERAK